MTPIRPDAIVGRTIAVEVPATGANLGAGYDVLALALELPLRVRVTARSEPGVARVVTGEGSGVVGAGSEDRFLRGLEAGLVECGVEPVVGSASLGWAIEMDNPIPLGRGLGSSAAATVGGLIAARTFTGSSMSDERLLALATEIEGHPDNAAAALLGGFVLTVQTEEGLQTARFPPPVELRAVVFIPDRQLATSAMRRVLPETVPHADAVFNAGRVGLAVAAFATGHLEWLAAATEDRLHQRYRTAAFPALPALILAARRAGALGACLSGAGSTVIAFTRSGETGAVEAAFASAAASADETGAVRTLLLRSSGARVAIG